MTKRPRVKATRVIQLALPITSQDPRKRVSAVRDETALSADEFIWILLPCCPILLTYPLLHCKEQNSFLLSPDMFLYVKGICLLFYYLTIRPSPNRYELPVFSDVHH